ncbi:WEB family protein [Cinnamomum micranthum f. kanehirae]|uniref:WEB family protein n=1 Tax=Cinnamomum micranthum f. kanehirae TaxID=337451 RepID=A0A3S3P5D6_9MAGN|nr:WEB family protein [Cinnamomum micranthum f. kanehirae]
MGIKSRENSIDSSKVVVGEIDTRAPFQSVRAAVSLFGEGSLINSKTALKKPKPLLTEQKVLAKDTQLHLATKELNKFKEQLKNAETMKAQALIELEKAKRTVEDLTLKLKTLNEGKDSAIKVTEAAKSQAKQIETVNSIVHTGNGAIWENELENAREQYTATVKELDTVKQELVNVQQDFVVSVNTKISAFERVAEAEAVAKANKERGNELSMEIAAVQESLVHVGIAATQSRQEQKQRKNLELLKKDFDPDHQRLLEEKLAETFAEIGFLQREIVNARLSQMDTVKTITNNLDDAKETLQKLAEEENSLKDMVDSLKRDIENVKQEHSELKERELEVASIVGSLHVKLRKSKAELEAALAGESEARGGSEELFMTLQQLSSESEDARKEVELLNSNIEDLKKESRMTLIALEEAEKKLQVALKEAEEAKVAEAIALDQIKILSDKTNASRALTSGSDTQLTISLEEYESLRRKVEESNMLAEMKVAAVMAQIKAVKAGEDEAMKRLEGARKEIEEMNMAAKEALKQAEMAEAAQRAVEVELRRWREREHKRAAETASLILADTEASPKPSPTSAGIAEILNTNSAGIDWGHKMEKASVVKKAFLPSISGIFQRRRFLFESRSPLGEKSA